MPKSKFDVEVKKFTDGAVVQVRHAETGCPLVCSAHENVNSMSCEHIVRIIKDNLDADELWNNGVPTFLRVPVIPSFGIIEGVSLESFGEDNNPIRRVMWKTPNSFSSDEFGALTDTVFIGFFSPGEGRGMLRQLISNELEIRLDAIKSCPASHHSVAAEREWQDRKMKTLDHFLDRYRVLYNGMCLYCQNISRNFNSPTFDMNAEDLIPESSAGQAPSFWIQQNEKPPHSGRRPGKFPPKPSPKDQSNNALFPKKA